MKNKIHRLLAICMAFMVMMSTMSFTVAKHYCMDFLMDTAIFSPLDSCSMDIQKSDCETQVTKSSCCKDKVVTIDGQNDLTKMSFEDFSFQQQVFIASFTYAYLVLFNEDDIDNPHFTAYTPPELVRNIHILHETYLI